MLVSNLDHINLRAPRELLDQLRDFYCDVVGLEQGRRPPFRVYGYWLYTGARAVVHLSLAKDDESLATDVPSTFAHVAFTCSGRTAYEKHLSACGVKYDVAVVPDVGITQLFCQDPAGNVVELSFADGET